jgi:hypothetical protein
MATSLASAIGGSADDSRFGVDWVRPDGKFLSIEADGAYLYASESSYRDFLAGVETYYSPVIDGGEWGTWGSRDWASEFAHLTSGEAQHVGDDCWVVVLVRADGRCVVIDGAACGVAPDRSYWDHRHDDDFDETKWEHFEF